MKFLPPLVRGTLIRRYKRFLADIEMEDGHVVTAHCANPGSMLSVNAPGSEVWLAETSDPRRKLRYSWELIRVGRALVGINTQHPNRIVEEAIVEKRIAELTGYAALRREVRYGKNSRIDILLEAPDRPPCYVEVKNVTMKRGPAASAPAEFPDSPTARGKKHLDELAGVAKAGMRAVMFFLVNRNDARAFAPAADIDPAYAEGLARARAGGVEVLCYGCRVGVGEIRVEGTLAIRL